MNQISGIEYSWLIAAFKQIKLETVFKGKVFVDLDHVQVAVILVNVDL
jgi:hypothetical protein